MSEGCGAWSRTEIFAGVLSMRPKHEARCLSTCGSILSLQVYIEIGRMYE